MIKLVLIEDHLLIREAWKDMLTQIGHMSVVGEADNTIDGYQQVMQTQPDVILMDINLRDENASGLITRICNTIPNPRIIAVSMIEELAIIKKLFSLGIRGYVSKNSSKHDFIEAIDKVYAGEKYTCSVVQNIFFQGSLRDEKKTVNALSLREIDILKYIARGYSNKDIGAQLNLSVKTVEGHKTKAYRKLGAKSLADLIAYAKAKGLDM